ncbi:GGDEF domain-containing protein [Niallia endozanthoxylica]|nr:GGDEF domain-containing protein [Niallia endozanthoxylica]
MYRDLLMNLTLIISFLSISGQFFKESPMNATRRNQIFSGILAGILGCILMYFSINVTDILIMDLRNFTIIIATVYGGILSGGIAAIICIFGRVLLFGINPGSIGAVISIIVLIIVCGLLLKTKMSTFNKFMGMNGSSVIIMSILFIDLIDDPEKLRQALIYFGFISTIGGIIIYSLTNYISYSNANFRKLRLFEKVIDTTNQGVTITDKQGKLLYINGGFTRITGYHSNEVIGGSHRILQSGHHDKVFYRKMWDDLTKTGQWMGEIWNKNREGQVYPELLNISEVQNKHGQTVNYVAVFSDITEMKNTENQLKEANEHLQKLSSIDGLTKISNRRTFDTSLEKEWNQALRYRHPISIIMLDIDYFKKFNDTYGHLGGDECLIRVAAALSDTVNRSSDVVARYGGEEFAMILPDTNEQNALHIAEKVRSNIELLNIPHKNSLISDHVTISAGVVTIFPEEQIKLVELLLHADQALYKAKEHGRNRVEIYQI